MIPKDKNLSPFQRQILGDLLNNPNKGDCDLTDETQELTDEELLEAVEKSQAEHWVFEDFLTDDDDDDDDDDGEGAQ